MAEGIAFAVIGGSGLYSMSGLTDTHEYAPDTPFGRPSAPIIAGDLDGKRIAFLARHGIGHRFSPSEVNYRANIYALKSLGVERIVSISACGSLHEDLSPGHIVVPDQLYDHTHLRARSFFGDGLVAHISVANPFCSDWSSQLSRAVSASGATLHRGGTLITIEGPRFSTRAESDMFRKWGMSIIGMTACPEAFLAKEAEICYATMAHVTDYDVWHVAEAPVSVEMVIATLNRNTHIAQDAIRLLVKDMSFERPCDCGTALEGALITSPAAISASAREKLDLLVRRYLH